MKTRNKVLRTINTPRTNIPHIHHLPGQSLIRRKGSQIVSEPNLRACHNWEPSPVLQRRPAHVSISYSGTKSLGDVHQTDFTNQPSDYSRPVLEMLPKRDMWTTESYGTLIPGFLVEPRALVWLCNTAVASTLAGGTMSRRPPLDTLLSTTCIGQTFPSCRKGYKHCTPLSCSVTREHHAHTSAKGRPSTTKLLDTFLTAQEQHLWV